jgi:hypothetical protein
VCERFNDKSFVISIFWTATGRETGLHFFLFGRSKKIAPAESAAEKMAWGATIANN